MTKQNGKTKSLKEWHDILGHCNLNVTTALENVLDGMKIDNKEEFDCKTCAEGK